MYFPIFEYLEAVIFTPAGVMCKDLEKKTIFGWLLGGITTFSRSLGEIATWKRYPK